MRTRALGLISLLLVLAGVGLGQAPAQDATGYREGDLGVTTLNVLPPGQGRYMNALELLQAQGGGGQPSQNTDQLAMYDSLVQGAPNVTRETLTQYFKDASFGVPDDEVIREYNPAGGVTVKRDSFNVPHVYGATRSDVMFGAGYVSAEDRLFMMDTLRHYGRGRLSSFLGASEANLAVDRAVYANAGYEEAELDVMFRRLGEIYPVKGAQAMQDVLDYSDGINAFIAEAMFDPRLMPGEYEALQLLPTDWKPTDTVAVASLIGSQLGVGGGNELGNAAFLNGLLSSGRTHKKARQIFDDLHFANDPEAPVTAPGHFPYSNKLGRVDPRSVAMPDDAGGVARRASELSSFPDHIDGPFGPIRLAFPEAASNAVLVTASRSKTGRPLAVMGPQVGYWSPEILMELDLHGPGIDARGVGFPGISQYVLLGRGAGYAWSATSAGGDQVDTFAEVLCDPAGGTPRVDSLFYLDDAGECTEMYHRTDEWFAKPSAGGVPDGPSQESILVSMSTERTDDGIVQARGTVGGVPVAFTKKRASFGAEVDSAVTYIDIMDPGVIKGPRDFQRAFGRFAFTFNWFYVDGRHIAYQLGGYHPLRHRGVDPDLPTWGNGRWDWRGNLSFRGTPKTIDPRKGYIISWNNKQARGFRASDSRWAYGPIQRSLLLEDGLKARFKSKGKLEITDLVNVMGDAATQDLRGTSVLPSMLRVIGRSGDASQKQAVGLLRAWMRAGAHRRDLDGDGAYDDASAVALMDEWWEPALEAIFKPVLGDAYALVPQGHHDAPGPVGSAFYGGWYSHVQKDLRSLLRFDVKGPFKTRFCGLGVRARCRAALLSSLSTAIGRLSEAYGSDPAGWEANEAGDRIQFSAVGVQGQDSMQWQNRPTFQQVLEFKRRKR